MRTSPECRLVVLSNIRAQTGIGHLGGLFVGIMHGLQWIAENTCAAFVLKMDTDSLVIRPFSETIYRELRESENIGQIGTVGRTCNRRDRTYGFEKKYVSPLIRFRHHWAQSSDEGTSRLANLLSAAMRNGYYSMQYCQGGAYAVSTKMLCELKARHHFEDCHPWKNVPVGEDVIMGMYTYSLGLRLLDRSEPNQPFGLHWRGLPFPPDQLSAEKYAIVHSLKNNESHTEEELAEYFNRICYTQ
jgi:hypothetical protein